MKDPKIEAIKEKLKKLIDKEASTRDLGNLAEADAFASKIQELLNEYELEIDDLKGHSREYKIGDEVFDCEELTRPHESDWIKYMYMACSQTCGCRVMYWKPGIRIIIWGEDTNREILHFMVAQLVVKIRPLARKAWAEYVGEVTNKNTFTRSFYKGAAHALRTRLSNDQATNIQNTPQMYGIVLARDAKINTAIAFWLNARGLKSAHSKPMKFGSNDGFEEGYKAGKTVDIHKGVNANHQPMKQLK